MNNDIKEIIKLLNDAEYSYISFDRESCKLLSDYITKLEEDKSKMFETAVKRNNQLLDRIDRASNDNKYLLKQLQQKENIIKEVREILNNKREISVSQLLDSGYCNYEELLYQVDEEIRRILDKEV